VCGSTEFIAVPTITARPSRLGGGLSPANRTNHSSLRNGWNSENGRWMGKIDEVASQIDAALEAV